ncbi:MAG: hypothetical protein ACYCRH_05010 [Acidiferrobacteraceae bacterium]
MSRTVTGLADAPEDRAEPGDFTSIATRHADGTQYRPAPTLIPFEIVDRVMIIWISRLVWMM